MSAFDSGLFTYASPPPWGDRRQPLDLADTVKNQRHTVERGRRQTPSAHRQVPHPAVTQGLQEVKLRVDLRVWVAINEIGRRHPEIVGEGSQMLDRGFVLLAGAKLPQVSRTDRNSGFLGDRCCSCGVG